MPLCLCGESPKRDPAAWGSDHVGKPVPEFLSGDECLFCHRADIGPRWSTNRHARTIRDVDRIEPALAALKQSSALRDLAGDIKLTVGGARQQRFLRPSPDFGRLELLSVAWQPPHGIAAGTLRALDKPHWDDKQFGDKCAGCHASGVDAKQRTFSTRSLDCFVCHGDASPEHSKNTALIHLSKKANDAPRVVISICAQCHLRGGKSKSSGLPYANNFVAGDNLFRDYQVDFSNAALIALNPVDRHVLQNARDVVVAGKESVTCLSCHDVHKQSSKKHRLMARGDICWNCHNSAGSMKDRKNYEVHSATCGY